MRTLSEITSSVRLGTGATWEELRATVVAYDVLLAQLTLHNYPALLQHYFQAAEADPKAYAGPQNDPDNPDAVRWYTEMHRVTTLRGDDDASATRND